LFHFFVRRVLPATLAKLLHLDPVRSCLPVFRGRVVALLAITALNRNNFSGHKTQLLACLCSAGPGPRHYLTISEIVPAPTVGPPSRIANRKPFSIATGVISSITRLTLSPGITISVPAGNSATPVTSVVRK